MVYFIYYAQGAAAQRCVMCGCEVRSLYEVVQLAVVMVWFEDVVTDVVAVTFELVLAVVLSVVAAGTELALEDCDSSGLCPRAEFHIRGRDKWEGEMSCCANTFYPLFTTPRW